MSEPTLREFVDELLGYLGKCQPGEMVAADELASIISCAFGDAAHKSFMRRRLLTTHSEKGSLT